MVKSRHLWSHCPCKFNGNPHSADDTVYQPKMGLQTGCRHIRQAWHAERANQATPSHCILAGSAGRSAVLEVEAYVVDIENVAASDDAGLLNPLLHCFQKSVFNVNVWALPAVEVCFWLTMRRRPPSLSGH